MAKKLTSTKAKKILHDKEVHGHPLTEQQRKFFGAIAGGAKPYKAESGGWLDKYDAPQAQNGIEGTMGGLTDKGFNYNGAWGGAWRDGGSLLKAQTGDEFTPYSRNYLNNFRNEWIATYNKPIPYRIPRDDRFDEFYHEKVNTIPQYYKTIPAWVKGLGTDMEEYREGDKNTPPKSMGKLAKGYEWVENYRTGPFRDDSQIREYTRLIRSIRNAESRKPVWNRDVKFNFKSGGILQPPMAGANQTVPMAQKGKYLSASEYEKKYPPIYLNNPKDPRIGGYSEAGNEYRYKKPTQDVERTPIYTSDLQDPRLRDYQDSLSGYNKTRAVLKALDNYSFNSRASQDAYWRADDLLYRYKNANINIEPISIISTDEYARNNRLITPNPQRVGIPIYKKPVQPVVYRKRTLEKPNLRGISYYFAQLKLRK